jgi:hypothetical protein
MKITLESTTRIIDVVTPSGTVPARVWEGTTANGIAIIAMITRVATRTTNDNTEFERELQEHRPPSVDAVKAFDPRFVL